MSKELLNLTWNEFTTSTAKSYKDLFDEQDFADVTLVSDDDKEVKCHKVVLGSSSPVFKRILSKISHQHPLIYLSGVEYPQLNCLLRFIYLGQTDVTHDDLERFMLVAARFKIKGLSNVANDKENEKTQYHPKVDREPPIIRQNVEYNPPITRPKVENEVAIFEENEDFFGDGTNNIPPEMAMTEVERSGFITRTPNAMLWASQMNSEIFKCEKCDYTSKHKRNVRAHTLAAHEGVTYNCDYCPYKAGYLQNLNAHKKGVHKDIFNSTSSNSAQTVSGLL